MYDYVIVGAGSAGCVLAGRLTEDPDTRVLLLEAGPPDTAGEIHMPAVQSLLFQSTYDWNYRTVPQERAAGRSVYWPRGRTLGGSSSINAMIYIRGNRYDYNSWRDEYGCEGWGYTDLLPYFLRAEDNSRGASAYHGAAGPLSVTDPRHKSPLASAFVDAAERAGLPANDDFNGARQDGVGFYQVTQQRGRRWSAADAYLHPAASRPNLTILTDALVTGIAVSGGHAVGVRYLLRGESQTAHAEGEVILAAGAIGSPQLLMLSGIGPADHLLSHGITVEADSPGVGANLSDHPAVTAMWHTPKSRGLWEQAGRASLARWQLMHSGPMTTNIAESGGFSRSDTALPAPDIQWHALPAPYQNGGLTDPAIRALSLLIALVAVRSRGQDPAGQPQPAAQAAHRPGLPVRRGRHRAAGHGRQDGQGHRAAASHVQDLQVGARARRRRQQRRRDQGLHQAQPDHHLPSGRHLRDGRRLQGGRQQAHQRGRPGTAGQGDRGAAGGGRLGDAHGAAGKYQRADDRHRRAGRRPDLRPRPAGPRGARGPGAFGVHDAVARGPAG